MSNLLNNQDTVESNNQSNEIRIEIQKSRSEVFEYVLEPNNKNLWVKNIKFETIDTEQIGLGTIYTNNFGELTVTDYERNVYFELTEESTQYQCSYSFRKIDDDITELIYFESMLDGSDLGRKMDTDSFKKLQEILENNG